MRLVQENKKQAIEYVENEFAYETYASLRTSVGGINFSEDQTRRALERSLSGNSTYRKEVNDGVYKLL